MIGLNKGFLRYVVKKKCQTPGSGSSLRDFGALLFITGQGSYGTNGERQTIYELFVSKEDYERAQQLVL